MRIVDVWERNKHIFAYCVGENIDIDFNCKRILLDGKEYAVTETDVMVSIAGKVSAVLALDINDVDAIPLKEFKIVN